MDSENMIVATNWNVNSPKYIMRLALLISDIECHENPLLSPKLTTESYKRMYPGNYIINEYFDSQLGKFSSRLVFETPADKTIFLLRYA